MRHVTKVTRSARVCPPAMRTLLLLASSAATLGAPASVFSEALRGSSVSALQASRSSADTASMYAFWCSGYRARTSPLCRHAAVSAELAATDNSDEARLKQLSSQIKALVAEAKASSTRAPTIGQYKVGAKPAKKQAPFAREFAQMKTAFCSDASGEAGRRAKSLCSYGQYKIGGAQSVRATSSSAVTALDAVMDWHCRQLKTSRTKPLAEALGVFLAGAKEGGVTCARHELQLKARVPGIPEYERKAALGALKKYPAPTTGEYQAIYGEFCKVRANRTARRVPLA